LSGRQLGTEEEKEEGEGRGRGRGVETCAQIVIHM